MAVFASSALIWPDEVHFGRNIMTTDKQPNGSNGPFAHAMRREIYEQPSAIARTIEKHLKGHTGSSARSPSTWPKAGLALGRFRNRPCPRRRDRARSSMGRV
jgi:hypothetical protein